MGWVDIGVSLSNKQLDSDREQVVEHACQAGADWLVLIMDSPASGTSMYL